MIAAKWGQWLLQALVVTAFGYAATVELCADGATVGRVSAIRRERPADGGYAWCFAVPLPAVRAQGILATSQFI